MSKHNTNNFGKHTGVYQLNAFIGSQEYYDYDIRPEDLAILFVICRYLAMPKKICCLKQVNLAKECRSSESVIRRRCHYLVEQKILFRYLKGKLYYYELGEVITGIVQD